jgi:hypothetical protein
MFNQFRAHKYFHSRETFLFLLLSVVVLMGGCSLLGTHKRVQVPQLLTPLADANKDQLVSLVNSQASVKSLHGKIDLTFEDNSFAEAGIAEKYKQADATVTLQRPGEVYLVIQVPFIAKDIAQMTSDGEHFRVAVLQGDEKFRRFVKGTNNAVYEKLDLDGTAQTKPDKKRQMTERETVSALSNLRPQHLTDALMVRPILVEPNSSLTYSQSEFFQEESDNRPQAKKGTRVVRGYYLLEEFSLGSDAKLRRRFWFDRVGLIKLARLQTFDDSGLLITDVSYSDEKPFGEEGKYRLPARIEITRPHDRYKLSITYQAPQSVVLDKGYPREAFILENKWQLPEVDLDARQKTSNR